MYELITSEVLLALGAGWRLPPTESAPRSLAGSVPESADGPVPPAAMIARNVGRLASGGTLARRARWLCGFGTCGGAGFTARAGSTADRQRSSRLPRRRVACEPAAAGLPRPDRELRPPARPAPVF